MIVCSPGLLQLDFYDGFLFKNNPWQSIVHETIHILRSAPEHYETGDSVNRLFRWSCVCILCGYAALHAGERPRTKEFNWGSAQISRADGGVRLDVRFREHAFEAEAPGKASVSSLVQVEKLISSVEQTFFIALPPGATPVLKVSGIKSSPTRHFYFPRIAGYRQATDSSSIVPEIVSAPARESNLPKEPVALEGYEWYRGLRLAKIRVSPLLHRGSYIEQLEELQVEISIEEGVGQPGGRRLNDPHFEASLRSLVMNFDDLRDIQTAAPPWPDTTGGWFRAGATHIKLAIPEDAVYRLTFEDLQAHEGSIGMVDPRTFQMFNYGKEIPMYVDGGDDGVFSAGEYIEFTGTRNYNHSDHRKIPAGDAEYPEYLNRYTDTSFYWLTWGGAIGKRLPANPAFEPQHDTLKWYTVFVHVERNTALQFADASNLLLRQDPRWLPGDIWGWQFISAGGTFNGATFQASNISTAFPTARIRARMASITWPGTTPNYRVRLRVNNSDTLQALNDTRATPHILMDAIAPVATIVSGTNTIRVHSLSTSSINHLWFDWAEAEYPRNLVAVSDTLVFGFGNLTETLVRNVRVSGLTTSDIVIYKHKGTPKRIPYIVVDGTGAYSVSFTDTIAPGDQYYLFSRQRIRVPEVRRVTRFVDLRDAARKAEYLVITHNTFFPAASLYAAMVVGQYGLTHSIIDVEDIFDEFGFGYPTPESIRDFVKATALWQPPMPSFLVLIGDATYDSKFVMADPNNRPFNAVPSPGHPVSDPWLAVLDDASIFPQLYVGRIPVSTVTELVRYKDRVQSYFLANFDDWNKRYIFFSGGDANSPTEIESFRKVNDEIIATLVAPAPIGGVATHFYKTTNPHSDFGPFTPEEIRTVLDDGGVFINYIGHSGTATWDNSIGDPSQLQNNRSRFALLSDFGCSTAKFAEPNIRAFGESFALDVSGSAIGYVGNSALGFVSIATSLPQHFYRQFLLESVYTIGKAHLNAKMKYVQQSGGPAGQLNRVMMLTNTLIGDPAIGLAIPRKPNLAVQSGGISTIPQSPLDDDTHVRLTIPFLNTGTVTSDSIGVKIRSTHEGVQRDTTLTRPLPAFRDTLRVDFDIENRPGQHTYEIDFNPERVLDEIRVDDNEGRYQLVVLSGNFRAVWPLSDYEQPGSELILLNPLRRIEESNQPLIFQIDTTTLFANPMQLSVPLGTVVTRITIPELTPGTLYHWRARFEQSTKPWAEGRIRLSTEPGIRWRQNDSLSFSRNQLTDTGVRSGSGVTIKDRVTRVRATSSGWFDGAFGAVELNGVNVLPNTFGVGHTVALIDSSDLSVQLVRSFDTWNSSALAESLRVFLNGLPPGQLVAQVVIDEGSQNIAHNSNRKNAMKGIGSALIDSVRFRDSWAIIGQKGAAPGTVPEQWKKAFDGKAIVETTFVRKTPKGKIVSAEIGPAGHWESVLIRRELPPGTTFKTSVVGISKSGALDTLFAETQDTSLSLASFSASEYPRIKLVGFLGSGGQGDSPGLTDWNVALVPPAELALNYQSVSVSADTILEGYPMTLDVSVYNVGSVGAQHVAVALTALELNGIQPLDTLVIPHIPPDSFRSVSYTYSTVGKRGTVMFHIAVDPLDLITETYRNNNFYSFPVFVRGDTVTPTFDITFDGLCILDGDFVSARPEIRITVQDDSPLPYVDPANVTLMLNGRRIRLGTEPDSLFTPQSGSDKATVTFRPVLSTGEHTLSLEVRDASGNPAGDEALEMRFRVETNSRLLDVVNFPNPFAGETHFIFNLVGSRIPEEVMVKVYTVAGRLMYDRRIAGEELRFGFNAIPWNGRDADGNEIANGLYFYKIAMRVDDRTEEVIQKLTKLR